MEEPIYASAQREVQRKLGRCLIRLQQYELLLKELIAKRGVSGPLQDLDAKLNGQLFAVKSKTMGQLVGQFVDTHFQATSAGATQAESIDETERPAGWTSFSFRVEMPADRLNSLSAELQELVDLRNDLVHHFVGAHDLVSVEGCQVADAYLQACYAEIDRHYQNLHGWAKSMDEAKQSIAEFLRSEECLDYLCRTLTPTVSQREAGLPRLVELLKQAETNHAQEGWTTLNTAIALIKKVAPAETPRKHTFGSWRQVLHDAGCFEVRRRLAEPGGLMETWYRSRS